MITGAFDYRSVRRLGASPMSDEDDVQVTRFVELSAKQLGTVTAGGTRGRRLNT